MIRFTFLNLPAAMGAFLAATATLLGEVELVDFHRQVDSSKTVLTDATVSRTRTSLGRVWHVVTGHQADWPGLRLLPPKGHWDLSMWDVVALHVQNTGTNRLVLHCRVDNPDADGKTNCVTGAIDLAPGRTGTLEVQLRRGTPNTLGGKLFGMQGYPLAPGGMGTLQPKNLTQLLVFVSKPTEDHSFDLISLRATAAFTPPTAWVGDARPFFPFIDTFGQYKHKNWPDKSQNLEDLSSKRELEAKDLRANPGPAGWDEFGGWSSGPQLEATGFFRTEKVKGKWWLVDPLGRLFFSQGVDCVGAVDRTPIEEREAWFEDFPGLQPDFQRFIAPAFALKGHYAGKSPKSISFGAVNLRRKYGPAWHESYPLLVHQRLRSWGINTIGNWSDRTTWQLRRTPYTDAISSGQTKRIEGSEGYWGKFPDVFDPSFASSLRASMSERPRSSVGDPWCLGYFSDNEMSWGDDLSLALATLQSPATQPAKLALIKELRGFYSDIRDLNRKWGANYASWDALAQERQAPDKKLAGEDLRFFYTTAAEQYFRVVRETIKQVAPHQLYLGCRFAWVNARAAAAAAKYCDVVSYNVYRPNLGDFQFNGGADVPLMIGEFHFGALDRGMFHTGLVPEANQEARAKAYRDYLVSALRHPQFVGCHWFQYQDEPVTGRTYDGENYQIGFVDVADTPYKELIRASREVAAHMYAWRTDSTRIP